jgi:simple sugar transport system ATP-binding protein
MTEILLSLENVGKSYGAVEALRGVSTTIAPGEVVGLMGDNGAGKSTLVKILSGNFPPSFGTMSIDGVPVHFNHPRDARAQGVETVYQDLALCPNLTAAENIFLGREPTLGGLFIDRGVLLEEAKKLFSTLQSDTPPSALVKNLSGGQRQAVAIARAISTKARLVLLDEPTAAISVRQVAEVLRLITTLRSQGIAVILISHRMPDIFETCSRVFVLRRGVKVCDKPTKLTSPEELTALITGALDAA